MIETANSEPSSIRLALWIYAPTLDVLPSAVQQLVSPRDYVSDGSIALCLANENIEQPDAAVRQAEFERVNDRLVGVVAATSSSRDRSATVTLWITFDQITESVGVVVTPDLSAAWANQRIDVFLSISRT